MKPNNLLVKCSLTLLISAFANTVLAECIWPTFDSICQYYLDSGLDPACPGSLATTGCIGKDCLGKNSGEEVTLVPGGDYAMIWIARTEGEFFTPWFVSYPCDLSSNQGVSILVQPLYEDHGGCVTGLMTEEHTYVEFFANNTVNECFAWVECSCD